MFQISDQVVLLEDYGSFHQGDSGIIEDIDYLRDLISVKTKSQPYLLRCYGFRLQKVNTKKRHHPLTKLFI